MSAWIYQQDPNGMGPWTYLGNFMSTQIRVEFMVINLRNYVLGVFQVARAP